MNLTAFFLRFLLWHYSHALVEFLRIWNDLLWFMGHFFSMGLLLRTFFSPWRRLHEDKPKGFDPEQFFTALVVNIIMRIVGAFNRLVVLIIGIFATAIVLLGGIAFFIVWLLAPFLILALLIYGGQLIIFSAL